MGADLYIEPAHTRAQEAFRGEFDKACDVRDRLVRDTPEYDAAQKAVHEWYERMNDPEFYFRDSYNGTAVMSWMGLSWWKDVGRILDAEPEDTEESQTNLSPEGCRKLIALIEARPVPAPLSAAALHEKGCSLDKTSPEEWHAYFSEKRERLLRFLRRAADGQGLYASI
jgi:hypothetical protein